jgi:hypothetical protein
MGMALDNTLTYMTSTLYGIYLFCYLSIHQRYRIF